MEGDSEIPLPQGLDNTPAKDELPGLDTGEGGPEPGPEPGAPKKRRRRGPNKAKTTAPVTGPVSDPAQEAQNMANLANALGVGFVMSGKVLAAMRGEHWKISDEEGNALGQAWAVALAPYMPRIAPYLPFATAAIVTVGVFAPKVQKDRELRAKIPRALPVTESAPQTTGIAAAPVVAQPPSVSPVAPGAAGPDAPHLAYEGGFAPPNATEGSNASARSRKRSSAPASDS